MILFRRNETFKNISEVIQQLINSCNLPVAPAVGSLHEPSNPATQNKSAPLLDEGRDSKTLKYTLPGSSFLPLGLMDPGWDKILKNYEFKCQI